jgi:hypothetical protein
MISAQVWTANPHRNKVKHKERQRKEMYGIMDQFDGTILCKNSDKNSKKRWTHFIYYYNISTRKNTILKSKRITVKENIYGNVRLYD